MARASLGNQLARFRRGAADVVAKQAVNISRGIQALEVSGTAFGMSWARGRFATVNAETGQPEFGLFGIDWELWVGLGLHALGFAGLLNPYQEHAHNVADGALAAYMTRLGLELGQRSRGTATTSGRRLVGGRVLQFPGGMNPQAAAAARMRASMA